MNYVTILIEVLVHLICLKIVIKKPITLPVLLSFLSILFSSTYLGKFNLNLLLFIVPANCILLYKIYKNKIEVSLNPIYKIFSIIAFCLLCAFIGHYLIWNSFPRTLMKVSIMSLWVVPFLIIKYKEEDLSNFVNMGAKTFFISSILLTPQAIYYYFITQGRSLGREVTSTFTDLHPAVATWAVFPTSHTNGLVSNSMFSMSGSGCYLYLILMTIFFNFCLKDFKKNLIIIIPTLLFSYMYIYVSYYIAITLYFHLSIFLLLIYSLYKYKIKSINTLSMIIVNIVLVYFTLMSTPFQLRIKSNFNIKMNKDINSDIPKVVHSGAFNIAKNNTKGLSHQSRFSRIKKSLHNLITTHPVKGFGSKNLNLPNHYYKKNHTIFSNHSYIGDTLISLGFLLGFIYLTPFLFILPYLSIKSSILQKNNVSVTMFLISVVVFYVSFTGIFLIQPLHVGIVFSFIAIFLQIQSTVTVRS